MVSVRPRRKIEAGRWGQGILFICLSVWGLLSELLGHSSFIGPVRRLPYSWRHSQLWPLWATDIHDSSSSVSLSLWNHTYAFLNSPSFNSFHGPCGVCLCFLPRCGLFSLRWEREASWKMRTFLWPLLSAPFLWKHPGHMSIPKRTLWEGSEWRDTVVRTVEAEKGRKKERVRQWRRQQVHLLTLRQKQQW